MMIAEKVIETTDEKAEIKTVIATETNAYLNRDVDALCDCWVQEPYLKHTTILPYCGMVEVNGITGLRDHFIAHFKLDKSRKNKAESIGRRDWEIVVRDSMAWATFEQYTISDAAGHTSGLQTHSRILEKVSGRWKLVSSTSVLSRLDSYDCPKIQVDGSAKIINASAESREVFANHPVLRLNENYLSATTRKNAARLKDAIQAAQMNIDCGKARLPFPVIFGDDAGTDGSLCWIAILDLKIVILLDDIRLIETTIETAGEVYGLSAAQIRVAEEIAKGKDLTSVADTLKVSTNTVRTHVKRMFERVGVNSQKALMKRLLSAQAPFVGPHY